MEIEFILLVDTVRALISVERVYILNIDKKIVQIFSAEML